MDCRSRTRRSRRDGSRRCSSERALPCGHFQPCSSSARRPRLPDCAPGRETGEHVLAHPDAVPRRRFRPGADHARLRPQPGVSDQTIPARLEWRKRGGGALRHGGRDALVPRRRLHHHARRDATREPAVLAAPAAHLRALDDDQGGARHVHRGIRLSASELLLRAQVGGRLGRRSDGEWRRLDPDGDRGHRRLRDLRQPHPQPDAHQHRHQVGRPGDAPRCPARLPAGERIPARAAARLPAAARLVAFRKPAWSLAATRSAHGVLQGVDAGELVRLARRYDCTFGCLSASATT